MAEPIRELIARNVVETLTGVSTAAGYNVTLSVERRKQAGNPPRDLLCIVGQDDAEDSDGDADGFEYERQPFFILVHSIPGEGETVAPDTRLNWIAADVRKALLSEPRRGAYAIDTIVGPPEFFADAVMLTAVVLFGTIYDDPYRQS
jgi:hypothetical protein